MSAGTEHIESSFLLGRLTLDAIPKEPIVIGTFFGVV